MPINPTFPRITFDTAEQGAHTTESGKRSQAINHIRSILPFDAYRNAALKELDNLEPEQIGWLCNLVSQDHAQITPHLNALLSNRIFSNPNSIQLLQTYPNYRDVLVKLMGRMSPSECNMLEAYLQIAPHWLKQEVPNLLQIRPLQVASILNRVFGLALVNPKLASAIALKAAKGDFDTETFVCQHMCEPTATLYLKCAALRKNTNTPVHFDQLLALSHFMRTATQSAPDEFQISNWTRPLLLPCGTLDIEVTKSQAMQRVSGVSRSTHQPGAMVPSSLLAQFTTRHAALPHISFGVEHEMYLPGLSEVAGLKQRTLEETFPEIPGFFQVEEDESLSKGLEGIHASIEVVSKVLKTPEDIAQLQSVLSRLNDLGARSDRNSGVHTHVGIKQWTCDTLAIKNHPNSAWWDSHIEPGLSRLQLQLIKQIVINFASVQQQFYAVARQSEHSNPLGHHRDPAHLQNPVHWAKFSTAINNCTNLLNIARIIHANADYADHCLSDSACNRIRANVPAALRYHVINTAAAFSKHGTIEFRGFTKAFSDHMEVDPNLPVRDLIYLQDLISLSLSQVKTQIQNHTPGESIASAVAHESMASITQIYAQDALRLGIVHALLQRDPQAREHTMKWFSNNKQLIGDALVRDLKSGGFAGILHNNDHIGHHFLANLTGLKTKGAKHTEQPSTMVRRKSLRETADQLKGKIENQQTTGTKSTGGLLTVLTQNPFRRRP